MSNQEGLVNETNRPPEPCVTFTEVDLGLIKLNLSMKDEPQSLEPLVAPDGSLLNESLLRQRRSRQAAAVPQALENSLNKRRLT